MITIFLIVILSLILSYLYDRYSETQYIIKIDYNNSFHIQIMSEDEIKSIFSGSFSDYINKSIRNAIINIPAPPLPKASFRGRQQNKSNIIHHCFVVSSNKYFIQKYAIQCNNIQNTSNIYKDFLDRDFLDLLDHNLYLVGILDLIKEAHILMKRTDHSAMIDTLLKIDDLFNNREQHKIIMEEQIFEEYIYKHIKYV